MVLVRAHSDFKEDGVHIWAAENVLFVEYNAGRATSLARESCELAEKQRETESQALSLATELDHR